MRLREASTKARDPEEIVYKADCQARKLCQGILTTEPTLILVAIEISVQNLVKEVRETSELEKATACKSNINRIDSDGTSPPPPCPPGPEGRLITTKKSACPNKESKSTKEPQADESVSKEKKVRKEAEEDHTFLSPDQEARVRRAASGFTNATEMLIRDANNEARLLCQGGTHMGSASAMTAIKEIVQTLVDALSRCKDRKERDEQIRMEEEWIENEVERKFKEKRFEDEVSKRVMEEMGHQSRCREEEIQEIGRAAQRGWGFLSSDQEKQISKAAISALREPRTSQHRIDSRARRLCRENPSMSLNVLRAHIDEMVHDLMKELEEGQDKGGAELNFGKRPGCDKSSPQEGYQACRPGGGQRRPDRKAGFEKSGSPLYLASGTARGKGKGWPWFTGLCADYVYFKLDWEKYNGEQPQPMFQVELVQQFREDCLSEKTAKRLKGASAMTEAWAIMDDFYYVTKGLMVEFQGLATIKKRHFERQHDHYFLIQLSISAADEAQEDTCCSPLQISKRCYEPSPSARRSSGGKHGGTWDLKTWAQLLLLSWKNGWTCPLLR
jgi:hypothetical protein